METSVDRDIIAGFLEFFKNYQDEEGHYKYSDEITRMTIEGERSLVIDYNDLYLMDSTHELGLSSALLEFPEKTIELGTIALETHIKEENFEYFQEVKLTNRSRFHVRFVNVPSKTPLRNIRTNQLGTFRSVEAIVVRTTEIKPMIAEGYFICKLNPEHQFRQPLNQGTYTSPKQCIEPTCKSKDFALSIEDSVLIDWQGLTLQERPEELPSGTSPKSLNCRLLDDIVDKVRPGDRVIATGIVRTRSPEGLKKGKQAILDIWLDVNYIEPLNKETDLTEITLAEEAEFYELAENPEIYDMIIQSIAPQIKGMEREKEAIMYFLFGGVDKVHPNGFKNRGQPNILLVGDPGVAKSQLLKSVHKIAPRGVYTSGKGSSAAGLTAAIIRDPDTGELTLEAGAMVLADKGVCLSGDTEIMLGNGKLVPIQRLVEGNLKESVLTFNPNTFKQEIKEIVAVSKRWADKVYELEMDTGDIIRASEEHPFPVWENGMVWKRAIDLKEGDILVDYRRYQIQEEETYPEELYELAAYLLFTEEKNNEELAFTHHDTNVIQRMKELCELFCKKIHWKGENELIIHPQSFNQLVQEFGIAKGTIIEKTIQAPPNKIKSFVSGILNIESHFDFQCNAIILPKIDDKLRKIFRKAGIVLIQKKGRWHIGDFTSITQISLENLTEKVKSQLLRLLRQIHKQNVDEGIISPIFPELQPLQPLLHEFKGNMQSTVLLGKAEPIITNGVSFVKLVKKRELPGEYVYNLQIKDNETFFANFIPVHNCLIDEFDKMSDSDRSAIHEAMEQQSYHPSTRITFADGIESTIGDFVDSIFEQFPDRVIQGINCEILTIEDFDIRIRSTDFKTYFELPINRVSRHTAPDHFIGVGFGNGEKLMVTPEHPMFVLVGTKIGETTAENLEIGEIVPAPLNDLNLENETLPDKICEMGMELAKSIGLNLQRTTRKELEKIIRKVEKHVMIETSGGTLIQKTQSGQLSTKLKELLNFAWIKVLDVQIIKNEGKVKTKWVYDITIEPTRTFISHNLILHNTISVAKAGIVATLNSRTGVLAAANPVHGRYEDHRTFVENVSLGPTILSRFDLIFILRDIPDEKEDESKAMHILNLHMNYDTNLVEEPPIPLEKLKKYIMFAKQRSEPRLTQEAINAIQEFYVNLRNNVKRGDRNAIPITARQLEGIVRLAEARARVALRDKVTKQDAQKAIDLMVYSLQQIAIDPETGELDYDALASGHTSTKRSKISRLMSIIENLQSISSGPFDEKEVYREAEAEGLDLEFVQKAIFDLVRQGALYRPESGKLSKL